MKKKDLVYLSIVLVLFGVAGYMLLGGKKSGGSTSATAVEVVAPVDASFDQNALTTLTDGEHGRDFSVPVNLKTELHNSHPFGD